MRFRNVIIATVALVGATAIGGYLYSTPSFLYLIGQLRPIVAVGPIDPNVLARSYFDKGFDYVEVQFDSRETLVMAQSHIVAYTVGYDNQTGGVILAELSETPFKNVQSKVFVKRVAEDTLGSDIGSFIDEANRIAD